MGFGARLVGCLFILGLLAVDAGSAEEQPCARIVSLAPSVTEVLFELGLGDRVVGVSRYDRFPAVVAGLPRVGGLFDPNYEVIVGLKPTLVAALSEFGEKMAYLSKLGVAGVMVDHRSIGGILESIETLGARCGAPDRGRMMAQKLRRALERTAARARGAAPVRTMVVVGGGSEGAVLKSVFLSGRDGFYDEIVRLAGGVNVLSSSTINVPTVSAEGLAAFDPEVIIQVRDAVESGRTTPAEIEAAWQSVSFLRAVKTGRVYVVSDDFVTIPGPRFVQTLERFLGLIHPELGVKGDDE